MSTKRLPIVLTYLLIWTLLFSTLAFGQAEERRVSADNTDTSQTETPYSAFFMEVAGTIEAGQGYTREVQAISVP